MAWTIIANSTGADQAEVNANFLFGGQGSISPRGGMTLNVTDSAYDLGSSSNKWKVIYANNIYADTNFVDSATNLWEYVAGGVYSNSSRIEVTGLNGDDDSQYLIFGFGLTAPTITSLKAHFCVYPNGDSNTANYGGQWVGAFSSITAAGRGTGTLYNPRLLVTNPSIIDTVTSGFGKMVMYAKTGNERPFLIDSMNLTNHSLFAGWPVVGTASKWVNVWNNTADTITSLVLANDQGQEYSIMYVKIWKKGN